VIDELNRRDEEIELKKLEEEKKETSG